MARRRSADGDRPARPRRLIWIWLSVFLAVAAVLVIALEVTAEPWFCGSCHEMTPAYQGWVDGSHTEDGEERNEAAADCMDCHSDPGIVGYFEAHVVAGLRDVYVHFIVGPPEQVEDSYVPNSRCLKCHQDQFDDEEFLDDHPTGVDKYCSDCHRDSIHTNDRPE